ncbi:hypothetical protein BJ742DRAFT_742420 [Cladochytrium replicatum]|nr:hypothetical protein BJ742DRAFT_742420 [Cladochytrium replicatum]
MRTLLARLRDAGGDQIAVNPGHSLLMAVNKRTGSNIWDHRAASTLGHAGDRAYWNVPRQPAEVYDQRTSRFSYRVTLPPTDDFCKTHYFVGREVVRPSGLQQSTQTSSMEGREEWKKMNN